MKYMESEAKAIGQDVKERWKDVEGYEGLYQVSDQGRLKALAKKVNTWNGGRQIPEKIIKPIVQHSGYAHVGWCTAKQNTNHGTGIARRQYCRARAVCGTNVNGRKYYFKSQADANAFCGVRRNDGHIAACCNMKQKTAYGFVWNYTDSNDRVKHG